MILKRKAISNIIAAIFVLAILVAVIIPFLQYYSSSLSRVFYSGSSYDRLIRERDSENVIFEFSLLDQPAYKLVNRGAIPVKIVRAIVLRSDGSLAILTLNIDLSPGQELDVTSIISYISAALGEDITPDRVVSFITSRGSMISVRNNIINLNVVNVIYSSEVPEFRPDRSLLYWNFSTLLNRIAARYSLWDASCSSPGSPGLAYMIPPNGPRLYPTPLLFVKGSSGYVWFSFFSTGSGCQRYVFKNLLSIDPGVSSVRVYYRFVAYIETYGFSTSSYDYWNLNITMSIGNIGSGYNIVTIPLKGDSFYSLLVVSATTGYIDIPLSSYDPGSKYDFIVTLKIDQNAGRVIASIIGLDYLVFQGAKPG